MIEFIVIVQISRRDQAVCMWDACLSRMPTVGEFEQYIHFEDFLTTSAGISCS